MMLQTQSGEKLLDELLKSIPQSVVIIGDDGRIFSVNQSFINIFSQFSFNGFTTNQSFFTQLEQSGFYFLLQEILKLKATHQPIELQQIINHHNKKYILKFNLSLIKLNDTQEAGFLIQLTDETVAKEKENNQLRSEQMFKSLVLNSTDVFQLTNDELKVLFASESVYNVLGYTSSEILHQSFFYLIHPDDHFTISSWLHWLMHNAGIVRTVEVRIKHKKGDYLYIEINGNNLLHVENVNAIVMNYKNIQAKKMAENALAAAEQRMGLLLNNTKESFIVVNSRLRVITYNKAAQDNSPYFFTQELQSGMSLLELVKDTNAAELIEIFEHVFEGKETAKETTYQDKNGDIIVYNHIYRPLFNNDEIVGVFITSTNITDKKKAEFQLKRSEERYKTIIQESFDALVIKNADNIIIESSPAVEAVTGYAPQDLLGQNCYSFLEESYKIKVEAGFTALMQQPDAVASFDVQITDKNNKERWVELKAKNLLHNPLINGVVVMLRDITYRKQAEELLQLSEQRFRNLVQSGADMISIIDEEGNVKYSSPTVIKILGNDPRKDIGKNVFKFIHKDDVNRVKEAFTEMLQKGTRQLHFGPYRFPNAKGEYRWLETVVTNLYDDPAVKGIVINSRDVTDRKRMNEEQRALTEELIKKNQDLQQFSFITSHNLRAPVANLISLLSLFNKDKFDDDFNKVLVDKFEEATKQLNTTLNDLLEVLVLKSNTNVTLDEVDLQEVLQQTINNISTVIKNENVIIQSNFDNLGTIFYNKVQLQSIFQNFISNSIKYRHPQKKPLIYISSAVEDNFYTIAFKDNGLGIDLERYSDRLFGLYQRFHAGKEGKGLGLYMIKSQIEAMGGKIEVQSKVEEGTTFKVFFKKQNE